MGEFEVMIKFETDETFEGESAEDVLKLIVQALQRSRLDEKGIKLIQNSWSIEEA